MNASYVHGYVDTQNESKNRLYANLYQVMKNVSTKTFWIIVSAIDIFIIADLLFNKGIVIIDLLLVVTGGYRR
jgi:hypothetical protein